MPTRPLLRAAVTVCLGLALAAVMVALVAGCASVPAAAAPAHCLQASVVDGSGATVCRLGCADFVRATKSRSSDGAPAVALELTPAAGERLRAATADAEHRALVATFTWDGSALDFRPNVRSQLASQLMITGRSPGDLAACDRIVAAFAAR